MPKRRAEALMRVRQHARVHKRDSDSTPTSGPADLNWKSPSTGSTRACLLTVFSSPRLSALLLQQPSLAHSASLTFLTAQTNKISHLSIESNPRSVTDMDDQDLSVLDSRLSLEQHAYRYSHRYVHLKSILVPALVDKKTHYSFLDISVEFIKRRPTSDLELVFKDSAGIKHQSNKFKKSFPIYWSLDMSVYVVSHIS